MFNPTVIQHHLPCLFYHSQAATLEVNEEVLLAAKLM